MKLEGWWLRYNNIDTDLTARMRITLDILISKHSTSEEFSMWNKREREGERRGKKVSALLCNVKKPKALAGSVLHAKELECYRIHDAFLWGPKRSLSSKPRGRNPSARWIHTFPSTRISHQRLVLQQDFRGSPIPNQSGSTKPLWFPSRSSVAGAWNPSNSSMLEREKGSGSVLLLVMWKRKLLEVRRRSECEKLAALE
jgi:hypothetical protein